MSRKNPKRQTAVAPRAGTPSPKPRPAGDAFSRGVAEWTFNFIILIFATGTIAQPFVIPTKQYQALVAAENSSLLITEDGIREIARIAALVNERMENIGARRLHTVMTTLLEDVLYDLPDRGTEPVTFNAQDVRDRLKAIAEDEDLRKYIL